MKYIILLLNIAMLISCNEKNTDCNISVKQGQEFEIIYNSAITPVMLYLVDADNLLKSEYIDSKIEIKSVFLDPT